MADQLAKFESDARLRVTIVTIVCAVALFVEFMLTVTLPVALPGSFGQFLFFERSSTTAVNPQFQLGLTVFVTILGIAVCLLELLANFGRYERLLLASVPLQIVFALLNMVCFVLWAMVTNVWTWFAAGLPFAIIAIVAAFGAAMAATQVVTLPAYVARPSHAGALVGQTAAPARREEKQ